MENESQVCLPAERREKGQSIFRVWTDKLLPEEKKVLTTISRFREGYEEIYLESLNQQDFQLL